MKNRAHYLQHIAQCLNQLRHCVSASILEHPNKFLSVLLILKMSIRSKIKKKKIFHFAGQKRFSALWTFFESASNEQLLDVDVTLLLSQLPIKTVQYFVRLSSARILLKLTFTFATKHMEKVAARIWSSWKNGTWQLESRWLSVACVHKMEG